MLPVAAIDEDAELPEAVTNESAPESPAQGPDEQPELPPELLSGTASPISVPAASPALGPTAGSEAPSGSSSGPHKVSFYQLSDGRLVFLQPFFMRLLLHEHGGNRG